MYGFYNVVFFFILLCLQSPFIVFKMFQFPTLEVIYSRKLNPVGTLGVRVLFKITGRNQKKLRENIYAKSVFAKNQNRFYYFLGNSKMNNHRYFFQNIIVFYTCYNFQNISTLFGHSIDILNYFKFFSTNIHKNMFVGSNILIILSY